MKHPGSKFLYTEERNKDLIRAYREHAFSCIRINLPLLMQRIVDSPSKRFWVSERRAAIVVSGMMKGVYPKNISKMKLEMYEEIYRRVLAMQKQYPNRSLSELTAAVVGQKAPKFYLTPGSAHVIIHKILKSCRRKRQEKLQL